MVWYLIPGFWIPSLQFIVLSTRLDNPIDCYMGLVEAWPAIVRPAGGCLWKVCGLGGGLANHVMLTLEQGIPMPGLKPSQGERKLYAKTHTHMPQPRVSQPDPHPVMPGPTYGHANPGNATKHHDRAWPIFLYYLQVGK